jgi:hypothetical protein
MLPYAAWGQVPAGPELGVNTFTTSNQRRSSIASDANGNFVVAWASFGQDGDDYGVFAQRFSAAGVAQGAEFRVNSYTTARQFYPSAASDANGNFIVVWMSLGQDGEWYGVFGQRFSASGAAVGAEFRVNTFTMDWQGFPSVASDANGNFVVLWESNHQDLDGHGIFGQRFDASGAAVGGEFRVNTFTASRQRRPSVASDPNGNFVVAWDSLGQDGNNYGVFGQRFNASGAPVGTEFQVNTYTTQAQTSPKVALAANGSFVVVWQSNQYGYDAEVFGQRFSAAGAPSGAEFHVNTFTGGYQGQPAVASAADGAFVVTWQTVMFVNGGWEVAAQRFTASGEVRGAEFRANTYTTSHQLGPSVASDANGNFVASWWGYGAQDTSGVGIFAQRFGGLRPVGLDVDTAGNHVWEPGEAVDMVPRWLNVNQASQIFGSTLSNLAGPAGATYTITDGAASYGTVANGATAACTDCFGISVSNPLPRPGLHWDAAATESITPDTLGQVKQWTLHVGGSFADVSTGPFYAFIETLLHNGVTAGCTAVDYCPAIATARDQMAVFVLVAREGAGYAPVACGTPVFADVPASSPFCRFVEELFRRGVIGGCGGSNYCPGQPVTREQMAVFVLRTLDPVLDPPACGTPMFTDVPASSGFCRWIEELARRGVVTGCGGGNYCPGDPVTREQMGVFISGTFGLSLYGP